MVVVVVVVIVVVVVLNIEVNRQEENIGLTEKVKKAE